MPVNLAILQLLVFCSAKTTLDCKRRAIRCTGHETALSPKLVFCPRKAGFYRGHLRDSDAGGKAQHGRRWSPSHRSSFSWTRVRTCSASRSTRSGRGTEGARCMCGSARARPRMGRSTARMSFAPSVRIAPSRVKRWAPWARGSNVDPGLANPSRPCSSARNGHDAGAGPFGLLDLHQAGRLAGDQPGSAPLASPPAHRKIAPRATHRWWAQASPCARAGVLAQGTAAHQVAPILGSSPLMRRAMLDRCETKMKRTRMKVSSANRVVPRKRKYSGVSPAETRAAREE